MLNSVHLLGRLAQEPEIRYTTGGTAVASFDLAVQVPSRGKNNPNPPEYIPIVCWADQAEFVGRYLTKGRQIVVDGRLTTRKWEDKNGAKRKDVEVTAGRIYFADSSHNENGGN